MHNDTIEEKLLCPWKVIIGKSAIEISPRFEIANKLNSHYYLNHLFKKLPNIDLKILMD